MEESSVLKREAELRKRNDEIKSRRHSIDVINSEQKSADKVDSVITESEASRRSTNAIKKFEKVIQSLFSYKKILSFFINNNPHFRQLQSTRRKKVLKLKQWNWLKMR